MELILAPGNSLRRIAGMAIVAVGHVAIVLGLIHGLARTQATFRLPAPIDWVSIVQHVSPMPPLATPKPLAQPRLDVIVPRNVSFDLPPIMVDAITPPPIGPSAPADAVYATAVPVANTGKLDAAGLGVACPNAQAVRSAIRYPAQARRDGIQGEVLARFLVGADGEISHIDIVRTANRAFNAAVVGAIKQFNCIGQGRDVSVEVPFLFRLE